MGNGQPATAPAPDVKSFVMVSRILKNYMDIDLKDHGIDLQHWNHYFQLKQRGMTDNQIVGLGFTRRSVEILESAEYCVLLYDHDEEKVRLCLEGKLSVDSN